VADACNKLLQIFGDAPLPGRSMTASEKHFIAQMKLDYCHSQYGLSMTAQRVEIIERIWRKLFI